MYRCSRCDALLPTWPAFERHADAEHGGATGWAVPDTGDER